MNETKFFEVMGLQPQKITDTQYLEMIANIGKHGYPINEFVNFRSVTSIYELRSSILKYIMGCCKWFDEDENEWKVDKEVIEIVTKILKGNK